MSGVGDVNVDRRFGEHGGRCTEWELSTGDYVDGFRRLADMCHEPWLSPYVAQYIGTHDVRLPNAEVVISDRPRHSVALIADTPRHVVLTVVGRLLEWDE